MTFSPFDQKFEYFPESNATARRYVPIRRKKPMCHLVMDPNEVQAVSLPVYISQSRHMPALRPKTRCFSTHGILSYEPFCDDFGPMDFPTIARFVRILDGELFLAASEGATSIVYCADSGARNLTNAVFLLGAYLILKCGQSANYARNALSAIGDELLEEFRDATYGPPASCLSLYDCWAGLTRAAAAGWIAAPTPDAPTRWGRMDDAECTRLAAASHGAVFPVVPGRLVALAPPRRPRLRDGSGSGHEGEWSAKACAGALHLLEVSTVVRLVDDSDALAPYDRLEFIEAGIAYYEVHAHEPQPHPPPRPVPPQRPPRTGRRDCRPKPSGCCRRAVRMCGTN